MDANLAIEAMAEELKQRYSEEDAQTILIAMAAIMHTLVIDAKMPMASHLSVEALRSVATIIELKIQEHEREHF